MEKLHSLRRWLEIIAVVAILVLAALLYFRPSPIIKLPGTDRVINLKESTQEITDRLKGLDENAKQLKILQDQISTLSQQIQQQQQHIDTLHDSHSIMQDIDAHW